MRITLPIDDQLLAEAEQVAAVSGKTLAELIEEALREHVNRRRFASRRERVVLHTFKGDGLQPGVNLDDSAAVLDLMNEPDATT